MGVTADWLVDGQSYEETGVLCMALFLLGLCAQHYGAASADS